MAAADSTVFPAAFGEGRLARSDASPGPAFDQVFAMNDEEGRRTNSDGKSAATSSQYHAGEKRK
jgi:hypothetical protein